MTRELSQKIKNISVFATAMIVIIHVPQQDILPVSQILSARLCQSAVPLFFFVSGYLLFARISADSWWKNAIIKRLRTLLLPFLIMGILSLPIRLLVKGGELTAHRILSDVGLNFFVQPACQPLWYLRSLFVLVLISYPIVYLIKRARYWAIGVLLVLLFQAYANQSKVVEQLFPKTVWDEAMYVLSFVFSLRGCFYFTLGMLMQSVSSESLVPVNKYWAIVFGLVGLFMTLTGCNQLVKIDLYSASGILLLVISILRLMPAVPIPSALGSNCFAIYLMHSNVLKTIGLLIPSGILGNPLAIFLVALMTIVICIVFAVMLRRLLPSCAYYLFGGR